MEVLKKNLIEIMEAHDKAFVDALEEISETTPVELNVRFMPNISKVYAALMVAMSEFESRHPEIKKLKKTGGGLFGR